MPKFEIHHLTKYKYDEPVFESTNEIRLFPLDNANQKLNWIHTEITGNPSVYKYTDFYGNVVGVFELSSAHSEMTIKTSFVVETSDCREGNENGAATWTDVKALSDEIELIDFLKLEPFSKLREMENVIEALSCRYMSPVEAALELNQYIYTDFRYKKGITSTLTTILEAWELRAGVCQDFAHVLLFMLRVLGIPARYVSGYICPNKSGARGTGATHAWVEAYLPGQAWIGLDPTNNCLATDSYVKLTTGRNFADCTPVKGTFKGNASQSMEVVVSVGYEDGAVIEDILQEEIPYVIASDIEKPTYALNIETQQQ